jgi:hypothetical protein
LSIYNSTYSGAGDSDRTKRAKAKLERIIKEQMTERGFKTWIKTECPATFTEPRPMCYHLDMGVLFRRTTEFDFYHFFAVEIDDKSHRTLRHDKKDDLRDESFIINKGIVTCRIPIEKIFEERNDESKFFDKWIYNEIVPAYIIMPAATNGNIKQEMWSEINRKFAIELKESSSTQCKFCDHKAYQHDLCGCQWQHTNKKKLSCDCKNPYFRSDE